MSATEVAYLDTTKHCAHGCPCHLSFNMNYTSFILHKTYICASSILQVARIPNFNYSANYLEIKRRQIQRKAGLLTIIFFDGSKITVVFCNEWKGATTATAKTSLKNIYNFILLVLVHDYFNSFVDAMISISQKSQRTGENKCLNSLPLRIGILLMLILNSPRRLTILKQRWIFNFSFWTS